MWYSPIHNVKRIHWKRKNAYFAETLLLNWPGEVYLELKITENLKSKSYGCDTVSFPHLFMCLCGFTEAFFYNAPQPISKRKKKRTKRGKQNNNWCKNMGSTIQGQNVGLHKGILTNHLYYMMNICWEWFLPKWQCPQPQGTRGLWIFWWQ